MPQGPIAVQVANAAATGNTWFVNETTGSDSNGGSSAAPFATLDAAIDAAKADNGDVVFLQGFSHRSTPLVWNKNNVGLVGLNAPSRNNRASIRVAAGLTQAQVTALHPLVNVTGQGCGFVNVGSFYGFDGALAPPTSSVCWLDNGGRNFYKNTQFFGGGDALMAALAGMRSLLIEGNGENQFEGCIIGLDTVQRITNPNASMEIAAGSPRNYMEDCLFQSWIADASDVHILIGSGGMDRSLIMKRCVLHNFGTAMAVAITNSGGSPGGDVILDPSCISIGATAIATAGNVYVVNQPGTTTSAIGLLAT